MKINITWFTVTSTLIHQPIQVCIQIDHTRICPFSSPLSRWWLSSYSTLHFLKSISSFTVQLLFRNKNVWLNKYISTTYLYKQHPQFLVTSGHISVMTVFGSGKKWDFPVCLGGSELWNSQEEENPQWHILVECHHLSDTLINNVFESFKSALCLGGGVHGKFSWSVSVEMNSNAKVTTTARPFFSKRDFMGNSTVLPQLLLLEMEKGRGTQISSLSLCHLKNS